MVLKTYLYENYSVLSKGFM